MIEQQQVPDFIAADWQSMMELLEQAYLAGAIEVAFVIRGQPEPTPEALAQLVQEVGLDAVREVGVREWEGCIQDVVLALLNQMAARRKRW